MGLFSEKNIVQNSVKTTKIIFKYTENVVFLGKIEYEIANKKFSRYKQKFHFVPFAVDYDFWNVDKNMKI